MYIKLFIYVFKSSTQLIGNIDDHVDDIAYTPNSDNIPDNFESTIDQSPEYFNLWLSLCMIII